MTPAKLVLIALATAWGAGDALAADGNSMELELCIKTARDADEICGKLMNDPTQRLECFKKARGTQLDCLERALANVAPGVATSENHSPASPSDSPASTGSTDEMSREKAEGNIQDTSQDRKSQESKAPQESAPHSAEPSSATGSAQATSEPPPPAPEPAATPAAESKTAAVQSDAPKETAKETGKETAKEDAPKETAKEIVKETPKTDSKPNSAQASPAESSWVVSETTSPVDYRPVFAAMIHPTSSSQDGASSLAIRCRAGRTELILRTEGTWHAARNNALPVDRQINDQAVVRQKWILAADAKTATYADDTVELLRSLPDGARLTLGVPDGANARRDATFQLAGWDAVRKRVETACKWPKATDEASSGKR